MTIEGSIKPVEFELGADYKSPKFFGPENGITQETFIVDEPLEISSGEYRQLNIIASKVAKFIDGYGLIGNEIQVGVSPSTLRKALHIDGQGFSLMRYGGLDVYKDPKEGFKVLEINPRVQAMGLQDFRQEFLGIAGQPQIISDFVEWVNETDHKDILVLGSRQNPFWRAYERLTDKLIESGVNATFADAGEFLERHKEGFTPDLIVKFCNNGIFLNSEYGEALQKTITSNHISIVNPIHSAYFGYRGFLGELSRQDEGLLPAQKILEKGRVEEDNLHQFPWIKLEAAGNAYVVNYSELRKWSRDVLRFLMNNDATSAEKILDEKEGGDAKKLKDVVKFLKNIPDQQIVWLAQSNLEPSSSRFKVMGIETELKVLYRVYWFKKSSGEVAISLEGFGCTNEQFKRSKGKINAGTGFAIPIVIK